MWRVAFVRPIEDPNFGSDAYGVMEKDADGGQMSYSALNSLEKAVGYLNSVGYEPMSADIDVNTNRWSMFWRRAEAPTRTSGISASSTTATEEARATTPERGVSRR